MEEGLSGENGIHFPRLLTALNHKCKAAALSDAVPDEFLAPRAIFYSPRN